MQEGLLKSRFSLAEARVLYKLAPAAAQLCKDLGLDAGYLSHPARLRARRPDRQAAFNGRWPPEPSGATADGWAEFGRLEQATQDQIGAMVGAMPEGARSRLLDAMRTIETSLGAGTAMRVPYLLRPQQPGDLGWIVHRQGVLYAEEHGFDAQFEALVAEIVAQFGRHHDPGRERCWIAERDGAPVGSVLLVRQSDEVAKGRAGSASAPAWSRSASAAPGAAIGRSCCGPTACCTPRGTCTRRRATGWSTRTAASARIWSAKPGN